jgi:hypothetical protein
MNTKTTIPRTPTSPAIRSIGALYTDYVIDYRVRNGNAKSCLTLVQFANMCRGGMCNKAKS